MEDTPEITSLRLSVALRATDLGIWDWHLQSGRFVYSDRARAIFGIPPDEEVTIELLRRLTHPDDLPFTSAQAQRALDPSQRDRAPYIYRIIRMDTREVRWVKAHGEAVFHIIEGEEVAVRYIGTIQDINEEKQRELELARQATRLQLAIDSSGMAVWDLDLRTETLAHSPQLNRLCGFEPDSRPSIEEFRSRYAPGERDRVRKEGAEALTNGERVFSSQFRQVWPDGTQRWLQMKAQFAPGEEGSRVIGVLMDVTAQKLAEDQFRELADHAPVAIWITDVDDQCTFMSPAWERLTGQSVAAALGGGWTERIHPDDLERVKSEAIASIREQRTFEVEYRVTDPSGGWRWVLDTAGVRRDTGGKFLGHVGTVIDITERHQEEENRKLLLGELHHRIKNSFAVMQSVVMRSLAAADSIEDVQSVVVARLQAMARAHDQLALGDWESASLQAVALQTLEAFPEDVTERCVLSGPNVSLGARAAVTFSLLLHELVTNALKYGGLSTRDGTVLLRWKVAEGPEAEMLELEWFERGGPRPVKPTRSGFGTKLIERAVAMEFDGISSLNFAPEGLEFRLRVRLSAIQPRQLSVNVQ